MKTTAPFRKKSSSNDHRWGIILAGGDGTRLQQYVKTKFGEIRPKQYCALIGSRSLLRHTIDRVAPLFSDHHLLTTINAGHTGWAHEDLKDRSLDTVVIQPYNRETGPGILLPLIHVHHADPEAIVALFPADHLIVEEERYRSYILKAMNVVAEHPGLIIALGVSPKRLRSGYGWIEKGERMMNGLSFVRKFWEKPDEDTARRLYEQGCLVNTMILIGSSQQLMNLLEEHMNEVFAPSRKIENSIGTMLESIVTEEVFKRIPSVNFSRRIMERTPENLCVLEMNDVYWNDWGDEERILDDIEYLASKSDDDPKERASLYDGMII